MNTQLIVAITLACAGVAQTVLTTLLANRKFFSEVYLKLLNDLTETEEQYFIKCFLHTSDPGGYRLEKIAVVSGVASTITSQCVALIVTAFGAGILAWVTKTSTLGIGWFLAAVVLAVLALGSCFLLLRRVRKKNLLTFGMRLRGEGRLSLRRIWSLNSAEPYVLLQLAAVACAAVVGVVI